MNKIISALMLAVGMTLSAVSSAAVISGTIRNIDGDLDGQVDDLKVSRILFNVTAGTSVFFDTLVWESTGVDLNGDGRITGYDNWIVLFNGANQSLASNDDSGQTYADGSVHPFDSTLNYTFATAGTYMVTMGQLRYTNAAALLGYEANRAFLPYSPSTENFGAWRLTMTASNGTVSNLREIGVTAVPEPTSIALLGLGLFGVAAARRKLKQAA